MKCLNRQLRKENEFDTFSLSSKLGIFNTSCSNNVCKSRYKANIQHIIRYIFLILLLLYVGDTEPNPKTNKKNSYYNI